MLSGYKTYTVVCAMLAYAIGGLISGYIDAQTAYQVALNALGLAGLRVAVK